MEKVITSLNATNWNGQFNYEGCIGTFNADGNKAIQDINGNKEGIGSFDAHKMGDGWQYNPHFSDITKAADLIAIMTDTISAVEAELAE